MTVADFWLPLTAFALIAAFTPGPNNLMLAASGMNYGFRRSIPHVVGVSLGFPVMLVCVIFGIGALVSGHPALKDLMRLASAGFVIYFAWKIATAETSMSVGRISNPLTLWQAALFQWVNPKGWAVAVAVAGLYAPGGVDHWKRALYMAALFFVITVMCTTIWTSLGTGIRSILRSPMTRRRINFAMAVVLVASMVPILIKGQGD